MIVRLEQDFKAQILEHGLACHGSCEGLHCARVRDFHQDSLLHMQATYYKSPTISEMRPCAFAQLDIVLLEIVSATKCVF